MKQRSNRQFFINSFPRVRMRRNRLSEFSRKLISENTLSVNDLIYPIFLTYGSNVKEEISSMPGIYRYSLDLLHNEIEYISSLNIPAIALFPKIEDELKTPDGKEALNKIRNTKIQKRLVMLVLEENKPGDPLLLHDEPIYLDEKIIGRTTSGNYSFNFKKNLCFGYIENKYSNNDLISKDIFIEVEKRKFKAHLLLKPLKNTNFKNS